MLDSLLTRLGGDGFEVATIFPSHSAEIPAACKNFLSVFQNHPLLCWREMRTVEGGAQILGSLVRCSSEEFSRQRRGEIVREFDRGSFRRLVP